MLVKTYIYLFTKKNHLDILGFHINDFDTGAVTGIGDTRVGCVSSVVALRLSGTDIDRIGNSFELLSASGDDG
jgi:hypothetical protein